MKWLFMKYLDPDIHNIVSNLVHDHWKKKCSLWLIKSIFQEHKAKTPFLVSDFLVILGKFTNQAYALQDFGRIEGARIN